MRAGSGRGPGSRWFKGFGLIASELWEGRNGHPSSRRCPVKRRPTGAVSLVNYGLEVPSPFLYPGVGDGWSVPLAVGDNAEHTMRGLHPGMPGG